MLQFLDKTERKEQIQQLLEVINFTKISIHFWIKTKVKYDLNLGSGLPPTPPPFNGNPIVPADAPELPEVVKSLKAFYDYLERVDKIIANYMRGYDVLAAHQINAIPVVPMEPCVITQGLLSHVRFRQVMLDRLGDYPSDGEQNMPEIIRDDEVLTEHANFEFFNDNVHHLYVPQLHCDEANVRSFNEAIIRTARRFRVNIDKLIEQRQVLTRMADMFGSERYMKKILNKEVCDENASAILKHLEREIKWVFEHKLHYEQQIENLHFAIEALRSQLLRMFDEMFARRMGWGYEIRNPGHKFMVFIRHTPYVQSYINPKTENAENETSSENLRLLKRSVLSQNCVIKVTSIDQLTELMTKKTLPEFQILHFVENEQICSGICNYNSE